MLRSAAGRGTRSWVSKIKGRREKTERESSNPKRHVKTRIAKSKSRESGTVFRLRSLSSRSGRHLLPGILLLCTATAVQRHHLFLAYGSLAHWAHLPTRSCFQPLVQAWPAEQVAAHTDDGIACRVEANVALEGAVFLLLLAICRAGSAPARAIGIGQLFGTARGACTRWHCVSFSDNEVAEQLL